MTLSVLLIRKNKSEAVTVLAPQRRARLQESHTAYQIPSRFQINNYALDAIKGMRCGDASGSPVWRSIPVGVGLRETLVLRCLAMTGIVI